MTKHEVRMDKHGEVDEIITRDVEVFHLEMMDLDEVWIGLNTKHGMVHVDISIHGSTLKVTTWKEETSAGLELPSDEAHGEERER